MGNITLNVIATKEDNGWTAVVLEMDLIAHAATQKEVIEEVTDLVVMQLSFAAYQGDSNLPFKAAPIEYFSLFAQIKHEILLDFNNPRPSEESDYYVGGIPMPEPHVIAEMQKDFVLENA